MKKALFSFIFLSLFCFNIKSEISSELRLAIQKSKIDLLEQALSNSKLTLDEKQDAIDFASEILEFRKIKINPKANESKITESSSSTPYIVGSLITGYICFSASMCFIRDIINYESESKGRPHKGDIIFDLCGTGITYIVTKKLWQKGLRIIKKSEDFRTRKQKYLDAFRIKQILNRISAE